MEPAVITPTPTFDVDHFIRKFEAIPESDWLADGNYTDKANPNRCCALGHCGVSDYGQGNPEAEALRALFRNAIGQSVIGVNDCQQTDYPQTTPRQRVLAALQNIKARLTSTPYTPAP